MCSTKCPSKQKLYILLHSLEAKTRCQAQTTLRQSINCCQVKSRPISVAAAVMINTQLSSLHWSLSHMHSVVLPLEHCYISEKTLTRKADQLNTSRKNHASTRSITYLTSASCNFDLLHPGCSTQWAVP